ncbi:PLAT domain-containing protein 1-like [Abeliophyllum distichum]|uniref:PLAT domain-containing protein 1-like n=1 Tax=Abeliophyllum distichum TaxID=126358 RepID=A0ABD1Q4H5_9LAMI
MTYPKGTTEPKKSVASPAQTVAGKDSSNPLMAVDLPKVQQTQETVDFPTNQTQQTCPEQKEIWDTLGEPSGKYDYLVKYSSSAEQSSPDKGKEIMQDSQDPEDDIISINRLLSQIQKLQDTPEKRKKFPRQKKKAVKKKKEDVGKKFEIAINKAL